MTAEFNPGPPWLFSFVLCGSLVLLGGTLHNSLVGTVIGLTVVLMGFVVFYLKDCRRDEEENLRKPGPDTKFTPPPSGT